MHRWKFNEASGNFADSVDSLALTASGTINYQQTDPFGAADAAQLATGQALASGMGSIPVGSAARTIVALVKVTPPMTQSQSTVFGYGTWSGDEYLEYKVQASGGCIGDQVDTGPSDMWNTVGPILSDNQWHLIALGVSTAYQAEVFVDGQHVSHLGGSINTGTGVNLGLNTFSQNMTFADLAVFNVWLGGAKLAKLWDIVRAALD